MFRFLLCVVLLTGLSGCMTVELGTNTKVAKDGLLACIETSFNNRLEAVPTNVSEDPRKDIAVSTILDCNSKFAVLEESLVADGEARDAAIKITDNTKINYYKKLIIIMDGKWVKLES